MDVSTDVCVVVPTIREESIKAFLAAWQWPCQVIVVEDNPEPTFGIAGITHYAWSHSEADLGSDSWIIPRRSDCIRSYGYWKAWQTGTPYIITLDDDCLPPHTLLGDDRPVLAPISSEDRQAISATRTTDFLQTHLNNLQPQWIGRWWNTLVGTYPRGIPYEQCESVTPVGVSHGLWTGTLDYDSIAQLHYMRNVLPATEPVEGIVPTGQYFPMCGMNLAWRREYTPLMYFLLMGQDHHGNAYPFDRFGDIWAGIIAKKILDHLGIAVWSGGPFVRHERASSVWANFDKEHAGIKQNERFWQRVDATRFDSTDLIRCYKQVAVGLFGGDHYWATLESAMHTWVALYA